MQCKMTIVPEAPLAVFTLIKFKFSVIFDVPCKITFASKTLLAIFTLIRSVSNLRSDAMLKRVLTINRVFTDILMVHRNTFWHLPPDKLILMSAYVYFKSIQTMVVFCTKLAEKWLQQSCYHFCFLGVAGCLFCSTSLSANLKL